MRNNLNKYKIKYSNSIKKYEGGSFFFNKNENKITLGNKLNNLNSPFDKKIFTEFLEEYLDSVNYLFLKNKLESNKDLINRINNYQDNFEFLDSDDIVIKKFYNDCYQHFIEQLTIQINNGKISDHSAISYTIDEINILSINLLDDTYNILIMLLANDFKNYEDIKDIYILSITKAFNDLRELRMKKILDLIKNNTEIICFQEVNLKMLKILEEELNKEGFNNYVKNIKVDRYIRKGKEKTRDQYRVIFYKNNQQQIISGEFDFTEKGQVFIIYKNILISSIHITWKLSLYGNNIDGESNLKINSPELANFIRNLIEFSKQIKDINKIKQIKDINKILHNNMNFNKILLIGDTNNSANNLKQAIENKKDIIPLDKVENIIIHETNDDKETFFVELNGTKKPDNAIEINLK